MAKVIYSDFIDYISGRVTKKDKGYGTCYYHRSYCDVLTKVHFNRTQFNDIQRAYQQAFKAGVQNAIAALRDTSSRAALLSTFNQQSTITNFYRYALSKSILDCHVISVAFEIIPLNGGSVSSNGSGHIGDMIQCTAEANEGYYFKMWSDGVYDNPRTFQITDGTFPEAIFESTIVIGN